MLLSLVDSISLTTSLIGADCTEPSTAAPAGAVPSVGAPPTLMPLAFSSCVSSVAAAREGFVARFGSPVTRASLTSSASYGPASMPRTSLTQLGAKYSSS